MLTAAEMKKLVDEIIATGNELREVSELDQVAAAHGPADTATLAKLRTTLGTKIAPSYLQLLSIYDGIECFDWVDVCLFGAKELVAKPNRDKSWVEAGAFGAGEAFVFAEAKQDASVLAFRLNKPAANGEFPVVSLDGGGVLGEYGSFESYLKERRQWFADSLATEKADRAGLSDDD
jgi:hypothetical protein